MQAQSVSSANVNKLPPPIQQTDFGFWSKFWNKVYSYEVPNQLADKVIETGEKVAAVRDETVKRAVSGVKFGLQFGPTILILLVGWWFIGPWVARGR